jgi:hypothetical protein
MFMVKSGTSSPDSSVLLAEIWLTAMSKDLIPHSVVLFTSTSEIDG